MFGLQVLLWIKRTNNANRWKIQVIITFNAVGGKFGDLSLNEWREFDGELFPEIRMLSYSCYNPQH